MRKTEKKAQIKMSKYRGRRTEGWLPEALYTESAFRNRRSRGEKKVGSRKRSCSDIFHEYGRNHEKPLEFSKTAGGKTVKEV